jgi:hypothetical protein
MKKLWIVGLVVLMTGCAKLPNLSMDQAIARYGNTDRNEAMAIAAKFILTTPYADSADPGNTKVLENQSVACLSNHWLVAVADRNPFWKLRYYYVIVDKMSGTVTRSGVNWDQGDQWAPMVHGIDGCQ